MNRLLIKLGKRFIFLDFSVFQAAFHSLYQNYIVVLLTGDNLDSPSKQISKKMFEKSVSKH